MADLIGDFHFAREPVALPYLRVQKGMLSDIVPDDEFWSAYDALLYRDYLDMLPHLPKSCHGILDIGAGMAGIDALLHRHYDHHPKLMVLDGTDDPPVAARYPNTFSNISATRRFLAANGVNEVMPLVFPFEDEPQESSVDLVVSFAAWCFHFPAFMYLPLVMHALAPGGTVIVDFRRNSPKHGLEWMCANLHPGPVIRTTAKSERRVFWRTL